MSAVVFYHHPCLDGSAAAWAAHEVLGDNALYLPLTYSAKDDIVGTILDASISADIVYFLDYHPPKPVLEEVLRTTEVILLDHHETTRKELGEMSHPRLWMQLDMAQSGASLAWQFFQPKTPVPPLIQAVEAIDLHQLEALGGEENFYAVGAALDSIPLTDFKLAVDAFKAQAMTPLEELVAQGKSVAKEQLNQAKAQLKNMVYIDVPYPGLPDLKLPAVQGNIADYGRVMSGLLQQIPNKTPSIESEYSPVAMIYQEEDDGVMGLSFRGNLPFDAAEFAQWVASHGQFSGGGHKQSSAARLPLLAFYKLFPDLPFRHGSYDYK